MKKLILYTMFLIPMLLSAQPWNRKITDIELDLSTVTTDTALYYWGGKPITINQGVTDVEVQYKSLDANDATIKFGYSIKGDSWNEKIASYTLNVADSIQIPGSKPTAGKTAAFYQVSKTWTISSSSECYLIPWITLNSVTSGTLYITIKSQ